MAPLSLLELCWDYSAGIEQTSFVLAAWACKSKRKLTTSREIGGYRSTCSNKIMTQKGRETLFQANSFFLIKVLYISLTLVNHKPALKGNKLALKGYIFYTDVKYAQ